MNKIIALILAGGRVDELGVLTLYRPKSCVPFGGLYRVIDFPLSNLMHSGIEKVGILSQYRSSSLINHIGIGASWDFIGKNRGVVMLPPFTGASASDWYKGTADAVFQNIDFIQQNNPELVLILSGDHIYRMNYQPLIDYHLQKNADLTVVFKEVYPEEYSRFGLAKIDDEDRDKGGKIIEYREKPAQAFSTWASLTIYLFKTNVLLKLLETNHEFDSSYEFGKDIIPKMIGKYKVYGYKFYKYWAYSKTIKEYWQSNMDLLDHQDWIDLKKWEIRTNLDHEYIRDRIPTKILSSAQIKDTLFYNGCRIDGIVDHSILFHGVRIEKGAEISDSVIMFDTQICKGARISKTIIGPDVTVGKNAIVGVEPSSPIEYKKETEGITVIGEGSEIPESTIIERDCVIYPHLRMEDFPDRKIKSGEILT